MSGIYRADKETFHTCAPARYEGLANTLDAQGILIDDDDRKASNIALRSAGECYGLRVKPGGSSGKVIAPGGYSSWRSATKGSTFVAWRAGM